MTHDETKMTREVDMKDGKKEERKTMKDGRAQGKGNAMKKRQAKRNGENKGKQTQERVAKKE